MKGKKIYIFLGTLLAILMIVSGAMAQGPTGPYDENGNYYERFEAAYIPWDIAKDEAAGKVFPLPNTNYECPGHLATITSQGENDFALPFSDFEYYPWWLGGYQDETATAEGEGWKWVTDEPWEYSNWASGEPNDVPNAGENQEEDFLQTWYVFNDNTTWNDEGKATHIPKSKVSVWGYVVEYECPLIVQIDIKPGSDPNSINLKSKGVVPVAILTTTDFDASIVDPVTVKFADASPLRWALEDVDNDGDMDLLFHFKTQELNLDETSTEATLIGNTLEEFMFDADGAILGTDSVNIVPGN